MKTKTFSTFALSFLLVTCLFVIAWPAAAKSINPYYTDKKIAFEDFKNRSKS